MKKKQTIISIDWSAHKKITKRDKEEEEAGVKSPPRSAALCESAAGAPGVSSPPASLHLPTLLLFSPPALPLLPLPPHRRASSVVAPAGPHWLLAAPGFAGRANEDEGQGREWGGMKGGRQRSDPGFEGSSRGKGISLVRYPHETSCWLSLCRLLMFPIMSKALKNLKHCTAVIKQTDSYSCG